MFERDVRQNFVSQNWPADSLACTFGPQERRPHDIYYEHMYCGDEITVVGRFGQHLGQTMSAVFLNLGMDIHFGDFKTTTTEISGKVPDIILVDSAGSLKAVGEAKTPWMHNIKDAQTRDIAFRHYLGKLILSRTHTVDF